VFIRSLQMISGYVNTVGSNQKNRINCLFLIGIPLYTAANLFDATSISLNKDAR
jgi:hypothetical protein